MYNKEEMGDFGFDLISKSEKLFKINRIFHSVSKKYDLMNDLMSFGIHRIWKNILVKHSEVKLGDKVLDVAGGTGDLAARFSHLVGKDGMVVLVDINSSMISIARKKLRNYGIIGNVYYVQANAEMLPFSDNIFDCVSVAFGLRNMVEKERALSSMYRVLKPGGRLLVLDFSKFIGPEFINKVYDIYSFYILPYLGKIVVDDYDSYRYLVESIRVHPDQKKLMHMICKSGFKRVEYFNMSYGVSVLHRGYK